MHPAPQGSVVEFARFLGDHGRGRGSDGEGLEVVFRLENIYYDISYVCMRTGGLDSWVV